MRKDAFIAFSPTGTGCWRSGVNLFEIGLRQRVQTGWHDRIAMGFAAQAPGAFIPFAAVVIPTIAVMGVFTIVRLIDTGVQNLTFLAGIARIRGYYRTIRPESAAYFTPWGETSSDESTQAMAAVGVKFGPLVGFSTTASMIAAINSMVTGAGVALGCVWTLGRDRILAAVILGLATVVLSMTVFYRYQNRRFRRFRRFRLIDRPHQTAGCQHRL